MLIVTFFQRVHERSRIEYPLCMVNFCSRSREATHACEDRLTVGGQNQLSGRKRIGSSFAFFDRQYSSRWWLPLAVTDQQIRLIGHVLDENNTFFFLCFSAIRRLFIRECLRKPDRIGGVLFNDDSANEY